MTRFYCTFCGASLTAEAGSKDLVTECTGCRRFTRVPNAAGDSMPTTERWRPSLPKGVLALEIKFLCPGCNAKLRSNAEFEGYGATCPTCQREVTIPFWSHTPSADASAAAPIAHLSPAEVEFLSGFDEIESA